MRLTTDTKVSVKLFMSFFLDLRGPAFVMPVTMNANNRSIKVLILSKADDVTKSASDCAMNLRINVRKSLD